MVSAIILTWNSARYIERCLQTLAENARQEGIVLEVFVVDGGSNDGTLEILANYAEKISNFRIIQLGQNLGTTVSRNRAMRESKGEYVLVLDSDTEILPGTLGRLIETLKENPRAGVAAPRLLYPDGSVQPSCKRFPTIFLKFLKFLPVVWLQKLGERAELYPDSIYDKSFSKTLRVDHCISACWLVRRKAVEEIGFFDEKIFYAPEDVDCCLRMWLSGWEVLYVPSAEVIHHTQRCSHRNMRMAWVHVKGLLYYFRKHGYWFNRKKLYRQILSIAKACGIDPPFGHYALNNPPLFGIFLLFWGLFLLA